MCLPIIEQNQSETPQVVEHKGRSKDEDHVSETVFYLNIAKLMLRRGVKILIVVMLLCLSANAA